MSYKALFFINIFNFLCVAVSYGQVNDTLALKKQRQEQNEIYFQAQDLMFDDKYLLAISKLKQLLELNPKDNDAIMLLSICYSSLGDKNQASEYAYKAFQNGALKEENVDIFINILEDTSNYNAILELLDQYFNLFGKTEKNYKIESKIYLMKQDLLGYIRTKKKYNIDAEDYLSGNIENYYLLLSEQGVDKAESFLKSSVKKEPENFTLLGILFENSVERRDLKQSGKLLKELINHPNAKPERLKLYIQHYLDSNFGNPKKDTVIKTQVLESLNNPIKE